MDSNSPYNRFDTENTSQRNQPSADPAMYTVEPSSSHVIQNYYNPRKFVPIQIVCGGISINLNMVTLIMLHSLMSIIMAGTWCGILFILAGSFQIKSMKTKTRCWIITSLVFEILSAIGAWVILILSSLDIVLASEGQDDFMYPTDGSNNDVLIYVLNALLIGIAILEFMIAILSSVRACRPLCNNNTYQLMVVQEIPQESINHSAHPGQLTMIPPANC